jgi:hypothetical protein
MLIIPDTVSRPCRKKYTSFMDSHPEFGLNRYQDILKENGLEWSTDSMSTADVSGLDGKAVMALLLGADRAERFCDGALLRFCRNGSILRWLTRLQEIDAGINILRTPNDLSLTIHFKFAL